ncbi:helix-turn-helix domain-containing protein [Streptomyces rubiginosohelvolus]|uniref:helix-turn-helix domain-containing protein n=1 Tax=Streptomyces rubiginosohelvolus TaxID=67362 RepID=UPI0035DA4230
MPNTENADDDGSLRDKLIRKLTGRAPGAVEREQKKSLPERLKWLEKKHKGDDKAASKAAGLSLTTWRRWRSGKQKPKPDSIAKLDKATRDALVPKGRRKLISNSTGKGHGLSSTAPTGGASLSAWFTISSDTRPRDINLAAALGPGALDKMVNAYIEKGEDEAIKEMKIAIAEYLHVDADDLNIHDVMGIDWETLRYPKDSGEDRGSGGTDDQGEIF